MDNETLLLLNEKKSEQEMEFLFALKALKENTQMLDNAFVFEKMVYVLNHMKPNVTQLEPPNILMVAKAVDYLNKNFGKIDFHQEIKMYIAHIAFDEGWFTLPDVLSFAENQLDLLHVKIELDEEQKALQDLKHKAVAMYLK